LIGSVPFKPETMAGLLEIGAPLVAMNPRSLADIYSDIELLGRITGHDGAAMRVARNMRNGLRLLAGGTHRRAKKPRVYCEAWPHPRISSPPWVAELIEMAGGTPAVPAGQKVSDEEVAAARPDVIVLAWTATGAKADPRRALENPAWRNIPAVRKRQVFVVSDELLNTPSPILVRGAKELARAIRAAGEQK
jgi:iron complex transport system substrate-binding protein